MNRKAVTLAIAALSLPVYAHDGMRLDSVVHDFMHAIDGRFLFLLGALIIAGIAATASHLMMRKQPEQTRSKRPR